MTKLIFALLFFVGYLVQSQPRNNPILDAEENTKISKAVDPIDQSAFLEKHGDPPEPLPIDDYLPLLAFTALGIIIYKTRKNRNLLS